MNDLDIGAHLVLACQRTGCGEVEVIDLNGVDPGIGGASLFMSALKDEWPEGWGWDITGNDHVLHCAAHRSTP